MEDSGCGCLIIAALIYAFIQIIIKIIAGILAVAVSVLAIVLAFVLTIGIIVGVFNAFKSFFYAIMMVSYDQIKREVEPLYTAATLPKNDDGKYKYYEEFAPSSYFNGQLLKDVWKILDIAWKRIFKKMDDLKTNIHLADDGFPKFFAFFENGIAILLVFVFGSIISIILSILIILIGLIVLIVYKIFSIIFILADRINFAVKKVSYRCDYCKEEYDMPIYLCPRCGVPHKKLRASKFGIFHRLCVCGEILPCTASITKSSSGKKRSELSAVCPICGHEDKSEFSRPLGIALIGGVNAGKTTFKTAFLYKFINEDSIKFDIDIDFPAKETEIEFSEIEKCYKGIRVVTETKPGAMYDVTSFNFFMRHNKFDVPRLMHLYDMPGEVFEQNNAKERLKHFSFSEGVVFIIDPYSMTAVINEKKETGSMKVGMMDIGNLVEVFLRTLEELKGMKKEKGKYILPIAIAINKVDTLELKKRIGTQAIEKLQKEKPEVYKDKFSTMDFLCREFLKANGKGNAVQLLDHNFRDVHYFSCSSMGYVPKGALARFNPEHIDSAVYWIMTRSDNRLKNVWKQKNEVIIEDISEAQKKIWNENSSDYLDIIENGLGVN